MARWRLRRRPPRAGECRLLSDCDRHRLEVTSIARVNALTVDRSDKLQVAHLLLRRCAGRDTVPAGPGGSMAAKRYHESLDRSRLPGCRERQWIQVKPPPNDWA